MSYKAFAQTIGGAIASAGGRMKSAYQIAAEIVDVWPHSVNVKSAGKTLLTVMIAEALLKPRIYLTANGITYKINDNLIGFEEET